ncbi:predicted protein [Plenodomus lingam JN3]|uniref:Predicted protein n=1 Tax=Leptosphaeria maculans (strain JN3 / isolate v23.1.3 / race Av1-4-5-6-7-8) TaxID=985895 RepID=E4ZN82_LEPMJ|nr:predicted protein [Plenodomus lingam JN3]CBX92941.1 predicted protein [Plenodomus lingam JN3]
MYVRTMGPGYDPGGLKSTVLRNAALLWQTAKSKRAARLHVRRDQLNFCDEQY